MKKLLRYLILAAVLAALISPVIPVTASTKYEYYAGSADVSPSIYEPDWYAQTFTPGTDHTISKVVLNLKKASGATGTLTVGIRATSSAKPTGSDLATGTLDISTLATSLANADINLTSYALVSGTMYAIVVRSDQPINKVYWAYDNTSPSYGGGTYCYSGNSGSTWATNTRDFLFEEWGESAASPTVTTQAVSSVSYTTATGNGNITNTGGENPSTRGICYSTTSNPPTTGDSKVEESGGSFGTGAYTESLTSLTPGAHYYARAYAINTAGTGYGSTVEFDTLAQVPTVTTQAASGVTMDKDGVTGGLFNGNLTNLGDDTSANVSIQYGFTTSYGSETSNQSSNSTGAYTETIPNNLLPGNTYHFRAKAVNGYGTGYGSDQALTFTMPSVNTQTTNSSAITGNISNMGAASNATVYFQWGYTTGYGNSTADQIKSVISTFTDTITGFLHGITLHFRAVCEVGSNTAYGTDRTVLMAGNATSEVGRFQPILPISGTTLPDRDTGDGSQDGIITWGNGLQATIGPILAPTPTPPATTPGGFLPTPTPTGTFGGNPPGTVGGTPVALYWFLITGFVILVISITLSWAMRRFGSGGLIIKALVVVLLMGILVAVDIYDWWMIVLYLLPVIAAMFASQDSRRTG